MIKKLTLSLAALTFAALGYMALEAEAGMQAIPGTYTNTLTMEQRNVVVNGDGSITLWTVTTPSEQAGTFDPDQWFIYGGPRNTEECDDGPLEFTAEGMDWDGVVWTRN